MSTEIVADQPIPEFLASLGLSGGDADRARAVLEAEGITNPRKTRLSPGKVVAAQAAIDARFARFCAACAARTDAAGREVVIVAAASCARCGGVAQRPRADGDGRGLRGGGSATDRGRRRVAGRASRVRRGRGRARAPARRRDEAAHRGRGAARPRVGGPDRDRRILGAQSQGLEPLQGRAGECAGRDGGAARSRGDRRRGRRARPSALISRLGANWTWPKEAIWRTARAGVASKHALPCGSGRGSGQCGSGRSFERCHGDPGNELRACRRSPKPVSLPCSSRPCG